MATFTSSLDAFAAWRAQRLPLVRYAPLALLIAGAACGSAIASPRGVAGFVLALSLIAQYRLWDDLVDRVRDRRSHPERMLARIASSRPFVHSVVVLAIANAAALGVLHAWPHAMGAIVLIATIGGWYRLHGARGLLHAHVLLLKYPAFVLLLAASPLQSGTLAAALVVYAAMCAFELLDTRFRNAAAEPIAFSAHALVLAAVPVLARADGPALLAAALVPALLALAWRGRSDSVAMPTSYLPFACVAIALVLIHPGGTE
jgi:hypothetical protein